MNRRQSDDIQTAKEILLMMGPIEVLEVDVETEPTDQFGRGKIKVISRVRHPDGVIFKMTLEN